LVAKHALQSRDGWDAVLGLCGFSSGCCACSRPSPRSITAGWHSRDSTLGQRSLMGTCKTQSSCQVKKCFSSALALISKIMVAMEPKYLLRECLSSMSPQQTWGRRAVEQRPIFLLLGKLIAYTPLNAEMPPPLFFSPFFLLLAQFGVEEKCPFPATSRMSYRALGAAVAAGRNPGLGGGSWGDCCEQHPCPHTWRQSIPGQQPCVPQGCG